MRQTAEPRIPVWEKKASKPLDIKPVGVAAVGETSSITGEFTGDTHRVLECTQTHPPKNKHQKDPICLWVAGEVTESRWRAEQEALVPLGPLPHIQSYNTGKWVTPPW